GPLEADARRRALYGLRTPSLGDGKAAIGRSLVRRSPLQVDNRGWMKSAEKLSAHLSRRRSRVRVPSSPACVSSRLTPRTSRGSSSRLVAAIPSADPRLEMGSDDD